MQMQLPNWLVSTTVQPKPSPSNFASFVNAQTDLFVESMQDAADNHWHECQWRMCGASQEEIGAEMEQWWNRQIRRFQHRLRENHRREEVQRQKRRLLREVRLRRAAEDELQVVEIELQQTRDNLSVSQEYATYLEEQFRCRECDRRTWD